MNFTLRVWRQKDSRDPGGFKEYKAHDVLADMSFLEMLDEVNNELISKNEEPIAFESDCREGICGTCCQMINGEAHGPETGATVCQLFMRSFKDGDTIVIEPWRANAFPILKDLVVDRSAFDQITAAGGFISANVGGAQDANCILVPKSESDTAMDAAACIGCGACVAACPNASAMLFTSAKVQHLSVLPQGQPERDSRVLNMLGQMEAEGFGHCTNIGECAAVCPKDISMDAIAFLNGDLLRAGRRRKKR